MPIATALKPVALGIAALLLFLFSAIAVAWSGAAWAAPNLAAEPEDAWRLCAREIGRAERAHRIPSQLLGAISLVESGRWNEEAQANFAWPWTVMAEGRGRYLPSKDAAIAEVRKLRARGVGNIDVGCMQVNLHFHPDAFASLEEAFDPARNVAYAARFLKSLRIDKGSWAKAVKYYHSATPALHRAYRTKVYATWRTERRRAVHADREDADRRKTAAQRVTLDAERPGAIGSGVLF